MSAHANDFTTAVKAYYTDLKTCKTLSRVTERRLLRLAKKGNTKARNELVEANLKFVFDTVKCYSGRGMPMEDLISEGNLGLFKAIEKFDEDKDVKFISYAVWWIRHYIQAALRKNMVNRMVELDAMETIDHEESIGEGDDETIDDTFDIQDDDTSAEDNENSAIVMYTTEELLSELDERERNIIELYFGIGGKDKMTLNEIGEMYKITAERVRQIKISATRRLRSKLLLMEEFEEIGNI